MSITSTVHLPTDIAPDVRSRHYTIEAEVRIDAPGAQGVLIAHGDDDDSGMRAKALHLKALMPELTTLLLVTADGRPLPMASPWPDGVLDFHALRAAQPADRLLSQRRFAPTDIAAYFHTGGTTGAPKLARHSHGAQVFTAWANATMQGFRFDDVLINGYPLFHVAGVLPGSLAALAAGMEVVIPTTELTMPRSCSAVSSTRPCSICSSSQARMSSRRAFSIASGAPPIRAMAADSISPSALRRDSNGSVKAPATAREPMQDTPKTETSSARKSTTARSWRSLMPCSSSARETSSATTTPATPSKRPPSGTVSEWLPSMIVPAPGSLPLRVAGPSLLPGGKKPKQNKQAANSVLRNVYSIFCP